MLNQSIECSQNRKKPMKKARKSQDRATRRASRRTPAPSLARKGGVELSSDNAITMEDLLDVAEIVGEAAALLDIEIAWPRQVDIEDAVDTSRAGCDDADLGRQLDRLVDRVGNEGHRLLALEPQALQIVADAFARHRVELPERLIEKQRLGLVHERLAEGGALLHAA